MSGHDNPPAFPRTLDSDEVQFSHSQVGMSLRDYFAGQAIGQAMDTVVPMENVTPELLAAAAARLAYLVSDAMLAERAKGGAS